MLVIAGAVASMSLARTTSQSLQTSQFSSGQAAAQTSAQTKAQNSSRIVSTLQLGASTSETANQSTTTVGQGGSGILSIYLTDAPASSANLKYLLVNVSSFAAAYEANAVGGAASTTSATPTGTQALDVYILTVPSSVGMNVNLSSLQGQSLSLGGATLPAGNISSIVVDVSGATAFYTDGSTDQIPVVADGELAVPIQFGLQPNGATDLTIDLSPNMASIAQGLVLTPVIHAIAVETGLNGTTTMTVTTTESLPPSTSTVTTTQTVTAPTETTTLTTPTTQTVTAPVVTATVVSPTTTTQTVTTTTGIVVTATDTVISPTTTTQTVTSTTTIPPTTTTSTTTATVPTTTTVTSTTTIPPTTTTSTTTATVPTTTTQTVTSTTTIPPTTVTSTITKTVTTTRHEASAATAGAGAMLASTGSAAASSIAPTLALGALLVTGVTVIRLQRLRRSSTG